MIELPEDFRDLLVALHDVGAAFVVLGGLVRADAAYAILRTAFAAMSALAGSERVAVLPKLGATG
jgi:hypothetical protein